VKGILSGAYYYQIAPNWVVRFKGEAGAVMGINEDVFIGDRFYVGGDNLRGFANAGIGPRDTTTNDALGGNDYYTGSVQLGVPLGLPEELGITGRLFTDVGSLWGINQARPIHFNEQFLVVNANGSTSSAFNAITSTYIDDNALRLSSGFGVSWKSPLGPVTIDLGIPLLKQPFDQTELIRVNFGTKF
jgi:outer membrane protein insertion porin family